MNAPRKLQTVLATGLLALVSSGCVIKVDLTAQPYPVTAGHEITYKVKVTNPLQCPVGGVFAFLFPLVPKDILIDKIHDPQLREHVSQAVDRFCADGSFDPINRDVHCEMVSNDLVCEIETGESMSPDTTVALASTTSGDEVSCATAGNKITCRIPQRLVDMGMQSASQSTTSGEIDLFPFQCAQVDGIFVCGSAFLTPGEMKMDEVTLTATQPGAFRNFVFVVATRRGGVCKTGFIPSVPCSIDDQCFDPPTGDPDCASGICDGGKSGFGCDADADCVTSGFCLRGACITGNTGAPCTSGSDCAATGTCVQCEGADGELLPGVACNNSLVIFGVQAPVMSRWSLVGLAAALVGMAAVLLRRRRTA